MANTFNLGDGNWAQKTEKLLAYNAENDNYKPLPFDFDRGSTATRVNRDGLIETVGVDEPRIDFLNNTNGHLLLEPSRTNNMTHSEDFSVYTLASGTSRTANAGTSPTGENNATLIYPSSSGSNKGLYKNTSSSTTGTVSCFVKRSGKNFAIIGTDNGATRYCIFDLVNETVVYEATNYTGKIEKHSNDWYRISSTYTSSAAANYPFVGVADNSSGDVTVDGTNGILIFGMQYEYNSYATSIIKTSGSAVTRSVETNYQQNVTQVIGQSEGTMYIEFVPKDTSATQILYQVRSSSGTIGQIDIRLTGGNISTLANDGGSSQFSMGFTSYSAGTKYKVAVRYKLNDSKIYINGSSVGSDTSCSFTGSSLDQISFAESLTSLVPVADILDARLYNTALSDSELQALTS